MQDAIDRDRAAGGQRNALRADRFVLVGQLHLAKEDIGLVLPPQLLCRLRVARHVVADPLHRHVLARDDVALDQDAADRRIGLAVVRIVVEAKVDPSSSLMRADPWICMNSSSVKFFT